MCESNIDKDKDFNRIKDFFKVAQNDNFRNKTNLLTRDNFKIELNITRMVGLIAFGSPDSLIISP